MFTVFSLTVQWPAPTSSVSWPAGSLHGGRSPHRPGSAAGQCSGQSGGPGCEGEGGWTQANRTNDRHVRLNVPAHTFDTNTYMIRQPQFIIQPRHRLFLYLEHLATMKKQMPCLDLTSFHTFHLSHLTYQNPVLLQKCLRSPTALPTSTVMAYEAPEARVTLRSKTKTEALCHSMSATGHDNLTRRWVWRRHREVSFTPTRLTHCRGTETCFFPPDTSYSQNSKHNFPRHQEAAVSWAWWRL